MASPEPPSPRPWLLVALVLAGVILIAVAFSLDGWSRAQILAAQGPGWKKTSEAALHGAISRYGDWPWLMLFGAAGWLLAWRLRRRDWQRILITAMVASTIAGILANSLRLTTGRTRPRESPKIEQGWYGPYHDGKITIGNSKFNSFPSGHTATAVGFAGVILLARPRVGLLALLGALAIAWSRMALGAHHLSDVVVASLLAFVTAALCWRAARRHGDRLEAWVINRIRRR